MTLAKTDRAWIGVAAVSLMILICSFPWSVPVQAQVSGATLSGLITDPTGSVVTNATISIRNQGTGVEREVTTNSDGFYSAPNLLPGDYEVTVTAPGFSKVDQKGITLTVGAQQALNHLSFLLFRLVLGTTPFSGLHLFVTYHN